jgi:hypothetical protein
MPRSYRLHSPRTSFQAILKVVVITGFNTDIEHNGTVYHVQTEDKGLETPLILSLVYVGGAILASKRSPYTDLVGAKFDAGVLGERLQRQHRLICAAISAGRIEDLKRLNQRETTEQPARRDALEAATLKSPQQAQKPVAREATSIGKGNGASDNGTGAKNNGAGAKQEQASGKQATPVAPAIARPVARPAARPITPAVAPVAAPPVAPRIAPTVASAVSPVAPAAAPPEVLGRSAPLETIPAEIDDALHLSLLEEKDFRAGEIITLRVMVSRGAYEAREAVREASVTVKILGTEFRPLILTSKTDADGVAVVHVWLPRFSRGRAAILVRATADGCSAELRRVIHHT